jgi:hypothetical protein
MKLGDDSLINRVDLVEEFFCAALNAQFLGERGGQRRKAGYVGKQDAPIGPVRQFPTALQCQTSIFRYKR